MATQIQAIEKPYHSWIPHIATISEVQRVRRFAHTAKEPDRAWIGNRPHVLSTFHF